MSLSQDEIKYCGKCKRDLPLESFNRDSTRKGGLRWACRECGHKPQVAYSTSDRGKRNAWVAKLKRSYNITSGDYESMLVEQGGVCAACGNPPNGLHLDVDHNHETGKVRGLLCPNCNLALGNAREDIEILEGLIRYIREHN